jgi:hypothetical protein
MNKTLAITAAAALLTLPTLAVAPTAQASGGGGEVRRSGSCSGSTDWKIKAKPDDGRIEVEAEIDSNHNGQVWRWTLRHNGQVADTGRSTTHRPSGSFEVQRRTRNAAGTDSFRFRAVHGSEVCVARVSL